jgi:CelD/BcsL family acetyltransferase involved in cellulose biosynthesis
MRPTAERNPVKARIVRPRDLGLAELGLWRRMQADNPVFFSPFLSPDYALAVDRVRGCVRVAVLEEGGELVGFFAFEQRGRRTAKPVGYRLSDMEGIVHSPGWEWDARELLAASGLVGWDFHTLIEEQVPPAARDVEPASSPMMDLSDGYEAYLRARRGGSKKIVQSTFRKQRKLARELGEIRFSFDERDEAALRVLMDWKSAQYQRMSEWDRFADPQIVALVHDLLAMREPEFSGVLSVLYVSDKPIAAHFGLRSHNTLACWFPAYDLALYKYSPGILLHFLMAEAAAEVGVRYLNLGSGFHEYKEALKTHDLVVVRGSVDAGSPAKLLRWAAGAPRRYVRPALRRFPRLEQTADRTIRRLRAR